MPDIMKRNQRMIIDGRRRSKNHGVSCNVLLHWHAESLSIRNDDSNRLLLARSIIVKNQERRLDSIRLEDAWCPGVMEETLAISLYYA